jgi:hypothetical protein
MGLGLQSGRSRSFEHSDSQCLESERGWGKESSAAVGDKSLSSWLRHQLKTLSDGAEDRSNMQRIGTRHGVHGMLGLTLLLVLACQYSSPVLENKSHVYHGLEILEVTCFQCIGKSIIQTIEETLLLLLIGIHIIVSVAGKLHEMSDILAHHHGSLL